MSLLKQIFDKIITAKVPEQELSEQCLMLKFDYGFDRLDKLYDLSNQLIICINKNKIGEYDGHEIAVDLSHGFMYMYGPSAKDIDDNIRSILNNTDFLKGGLAILILGEPGEDCERVEINL